MSTTPKNDALPPKKRPRNDETEMKTKSRDESPPLRKEITFHEEGDIVLILPGNIHVHVHSVILSTASPEFKVMFGPNLSSKHYFRSAIYPQRINLQEDTNAMVTLCGLLHHNEVVEANILEYILHWFPAFQSAKEFLLLVKKYDCAKALRFFAEALFSRSYCHLSMLPIHIAAAEILQAPAAFAQYTRRVIVGLSAKDQEEVLKNDDTAAVVSVSVIALLHQTRLDLWHKIYALALKRGTNPQDSIICPKCATTADSWVGAQINKISLSAWSDNLEDPLSKDSSKVDRCLTCREKTTLRDAARKQLQEMIHGFPGLCLNCIREVKLQKECTHTHRFVRAALLEVENGELINQTLLWGQNEAASSYFLA